MKCLSLLVWKLWPRLKFLSTPPNAEADADSRAMTIALRTYMSRLAQNVIEFDRYNLIPVVSPKDTLSQYR